jgi:hypothetical protein
MLKECSLHAPSGQGSCAFLLRLTAARISARLLVFATRYIVSSYATHPTIQKTRGNHPLPGNKPFPVLLACFAAIDCNPRSGRPFKSRRGTSFEGHSRSAESKENCPNGRWPFAWRPRRLQGPGHRLVLLHARVQRWFRVKDMQSPISRPGSSRCTSSAHQPTRVSRWGRRLARRK